ncbi:MAG: type II toxin-antitoxin system mRNA interferase toxin, RelE/StbE family [Clostridia bacterium]|nr:type II toxin-antitoxin system mRNA interferase toxin, RelE/StbE family [Clostridia bacterium]
MNRYTQRILISFFLRKVAHGKAPQDTGRPLNEDGTLMQYRIGSCRLICLLEKDRAILLAVTAGLPKRL